MEFAQFILEHEGDDLGRLALGRERYAGQMEDFDLALTTLEVRRKLRDKVPEWYARAALHYPLRVSGEQCSSSETARYKASVAFEAAGKPECLVDFTGGLGVDSWAFSQRFEKVLYNEMRPELSHAALHNFRELGAGNIRVQSQELCPGNVADVLGNITPDVIYLDPARRAQDGRKVFRLEDCQPDVLKLLPELLPACPKILLKLSPMADISLVCQQLGCVKDVHVVASGGECKELLLLLERGYVGPHSITVFESGATAVVSGDGEEVPQMGFPVPGGYLFEPGKALLKAGAFGWPCGFGLQKLARHTHLYVGEEVPEAIKPFGKAFEVQEVLPLDKRSMKDLSGRYPRAEVTARNIPLSSDQLRAKLGVQSGSGVHVFGAKIEGQKAGNYLIVTKL